MAAAAPTGPETHYALFPSLFRSGRLAVAAAAQARFGIGLESVSRKSENIFPVRKRDKTKTWSHSAIPRNHERL